MVVAFLFGFGVYANVWGNAVRAAIPSCFHEYESREMRWVGGYER